jgi:hypothetical protein
MGDGLCFQRRIQVLQSCPKRSVIHYTRTLRKERHSRTLACDSRDDSICGSRKYLGALLKTELKVAMGPLCRGSEDITLFF